MIASHRRLDVNADEAADPQEAEELHRPHGLVLEGDAEKGSVRAGDEDVDRTLVKDTEDRAGGGQGKEAVVEGR